MGIDCCSFEFGSFHSSFVFEARHETIAPLFMIHQRLREAELHALHSFLVANHLKGLVLPSVDTKDVGL